MKVHDAINAEVVRARKAYPKPFKSAHEAYAVILEELEEFWWEVRKRDQWRSPAGMRRELIQVAAMAVRAIEDLGLKEGPETGDLL